MNDPHKSAQRSPSRLSLVQSTSTGFDFQGSQGEFLQVSALEEDLIRVRVLPDGKPRLDRTWLVLDRAGEMPREGRNREDLSPFSLPAIESEIEERQITLLTTALKLTIALDKFALRWETAHGDYLAADVEHGAYRFARAGQQIRHRMVSVAGEHYYGFGEVSGALNKAGSRLLMRNMDHPGYSARNGSPLYKHFPYYITWNPQTRQAFGLFYDNLATTRFDLRHSGTAAADGQRTYAAEGGDLDYYFIYGPSIREVVEKFTRLTGRMLMPPRWSLGYLGSTMNYTEAPDAQAQLASFGQKCDQYQIPCDLFHLSSGYTLGADGKRYVFTWNRSRVPEPEKMTADFHRHGIRVSANIKPALLTTHPRFEEVKALGAFIREPDSDTPQLFEFWGGTAAALDFTNPVTVDWWKKQVKEQLFEYGIDNTWNDNNEFEVTQPDARCMGFGREIPISLARPLQTLMMMRASYDIQLENAPDERPFLISRAGAPGMQRYVQTWSGDNLTSWQTLKYNIPMGLGLNLSGVANTGHDIGGFAGASPSPELFLRWVQNGIFLPRFTIHSWKPESKTTEPWMYPQILPRVREAILFRYRLIPYMYNLEAEAAQTGHPILRPLVYQFPNDPTCADESFDFMLGSSLLVASITSPGVRRREVYLPSGQKWYDFYTGKTFAGEQTILAEAPLDHIPLFVPEGGMIPMGEVVHPLYQAHDDVRRVLVFPHLQSGSSALALTEDDGHSLAYKRGESSTLHLFLTSSPQTLELELSLTPYRFQLPYRDLEIILPPGEKRKVTLSNVLREWMDEQNRRHLSVLIPEFKGEAE